MVSLLALASKALYERELLALRSENESLQLKLFWKDYCVEKLSEAMKKGNSFPIGSPYCQCESCVFLKRSVRPRRRPLHHDDHDDAEAMGAAYDETCSFGPWFASIASERFGLVVQLLGDGSSAPIVSEHDANPSSEVVDLDCHLVTYDLAKWTYFTYGRRLWGAHRRDSPELARLVALMSYLQDYQMAEARIRN